MFSLRCNHWYITALCVCLILTAAVIKAADDEFAVQMELLAPAVISEESSFSLDRSGVNNKNERRIVNTQVAAVFSAVGKAGMEVVGSIVEPVVFLQATNNDNTLGEKNLRVDEFLVSGDMNKTGLASFSATGDLKNLRVLATAHTGNSYTGDVYQGSATFRLVHW